MLDDTFSEINKFFEGLMTAVPVNIVKSEKEYVIQTTIQSKDFAKVEVDNGKLKICTTYPDSKETYYIKEIVNGCRSFQFMDANMKDSKAFMHNGLLKIVIPIPERTLTKNIIIQ